jgi:hypothetical protein
MKNTEVQGLKTRRNKRKVTKEMTVALHKLYSNLIADALSSFLLLLHGSKNNETLSLFIFLCAPQERQ